jgi:hypothetical protein
MRLRTGAYPQVLSKFIRRKERPYSFPTCICRASCISIWVPQQIPNGSSTPLCPKEGTGCVVGYGPKVYTRHCFQKTLTSHYPGQAGAQPTNGLAPQLPTPGHLGASGTLGLWGSRPTSDQRGGQPRWLHLRYVSQHKHAMITVLSFH